MYRITPRHEEKVTLETTSTLDHAIHCARLRSMALGRTLTVREGLRVRAVVAEGCAFWADDCKKCGASGKAAANAFGYAPACHVCDGAGFTATTPCPR